MGEVVSSTRQTLKNLITHTYNTLAGSVNPGRGAAGFVMTQEQLLCGMKHWVYERIKQSSQLEPKVAETTETSAIPIIAQARGSKESFLSRIKHLKQLLYQSVNLLIKRGELPFQSVNLLSKSAASVSQSAQQVNQHQLLPQQVCHLLRSTPSESASARHLPL